MRAPPISVECLFSTTLLPGGAPAAPPLPPGPPPSSVRMGAPAPLVGRCTLTVSKPVSKAPIVSALEATI